MKFILISIQIFTIILKLNSQNKNNYSILFHNSNDLKNINYTSVKDTIESIRLNEIFNKKEVFVWKKNLKSKILKDSLYGYRSNDNFNFRFFKNNIYKIIDTSSLIVIYHMNLSTLINKGKSNITRYFYSLGFDGNLKKLSIENLLTDLSFNQEICRNLKTNFQYNTELMEYDLCSKNFKILNYIKN